MSDHLTNYESPLPNNIICGTPQKISVMYSEINIYNGNSNHPLQKYWFILKSVKIVEYSRENNITIALSNSDSDKNFIKYIDKLDNDIYDMVCELWDEKFDKKNSYSNKKYSPVLLNLNDFSNCVIFNEKNKRIKELIANDYQKYTVSILIELSNIMIGDSQYWIKYSAKQLKLNSIVLNNKSIFDLITEESDTTNIQSTNQMIIPLPPPLPFLLNNNNNNHNISTNNTVNTNTNNNINTTNTTTTNINNASRDGNNVIKSKLKFVVSVNDLKDQINKIRNKKSFRDEEESMRIQIKNMENEMEQFKNNQKITSEKYKAIVESINIEN